MKSVSIEWVERALGVTAPFLNALSTPILSVSTDSRQIEPGALFVALEGENFDGHEYIIPAFQKGAVAALVSRPVKGASGVQIVVPDTLTAYGDLSRAYRRLFPELPVIGITGSVGKTSTKEMIASVLSTRFNTLFTLKNHNNEIGLPQTLFQIEPEHEAVVLEMGMRGPGEIARLAEIAEPTLGIVTQIGYAHIERLGSRENIARAKSELFAGLKNGTAIVPLHDEYAETLLASVPEGCRIVTVSTDPKMEADVRLNPPASASVSVFGQNIELTLSAPGVHQTTNALFALAVAHLLDIPLRSANVALENWKGAEGRMTVRQIGAMTLLDDCYNAGLESMQSALKTLRSFRAGGVAILGEMKELGEFAPQLHQMVGKAVQEAEVRLLITVGERANEIANGAGASFPHLSFPDSETASLHVGEHLKPDDVVLIKGSRAMKMEKIVDALLSRKDTHL